MADEHTPAVEVSSAKHIGIVACSAEGAALCFREIARYSSQFMGKHRHPQVTLSCIAMREWMRAFDRADYKAVADIIFRELVNGSFPERSRLLYNEVIARMEQRGCDCVILGCTEIPLLVHPDDCPLPTLDSTRLLAHAAVQYALGK